MTARFSSGKWHTERWARGGVRTVDHRNKDLDEGNEVPNVALQLALAETRSVRVGADGCLADSVRHCEPAECLAEVHLVRPEAEMCRAN
jgi:hypothetical protein